MTRTSPITLHASPSAGFDQPFEMLLACHERVERMLSLLERLATHLGEQGADEAAQGAAADVMRYFDIAGLAHHEDEERHLFPRLLAGATPEMQAAVQALQQDHRVMTDAWRALRPDLQALAEGRWPTAGGAAGAFDRWQAFAALYRAHIAVEESQAYPCARGLIDEATQAEMGREMARRRGVV